MESIQPSDDSLSTESIDFRVVSVLDLEPNSYNPNVMEAEYFEAIVSDVKEHGMKQPILCRPKPDVPNKYFIIDGEHRWKACIAAGIKEVAIIVVPYTEELAKIKTLAMNNLRGTNIPVRLARLLVDLHDSYSPDQIRSMTGITQDNQMSVLKLLEVPVFREPNTVRVKSEESPSLVQIPIMVHPEEFKSYTQAMIRCMSTMGSDVVALVGHEVKDYDKAMQAAMGIAGVKLRNVALAVICKIFNELPSDYLESIRQECHKNIYDKLEVDAVYKEDKKQASDKKFD